MRIALNKVWRDLWRNKGRTLLVVMSIAVGVLAVGMIVTSNAIINRQLAISNRNTHPSHARIYLDGVVDQDTVENLTRLPGIQAIEGRLSSGIRWKTTIDGEWQDGNLRALADYENQQFDLVELRSGAWPGRGTANVAFNHVEPFGVPPVGGVIYLEVNEREKVIIINGTLRDPYEMGPPFTDSPAFYVTPEIFETIAGYRLYSQLLLVVPEYSEEAIEIVSDQIERNLRRQGVGVNFVDSTDPDEHFIQSTMDGIGLILTVMAIASLSLSTFLVINTINALLVQQVPQIGIMKTIGGLSRQIASVYLAGVIVYGFLSLLVAVPVGAFGGDALSRWLLTIINVTTSPFELLPAAFALQIATGMMTPVLAAMWPVARGVS
ncbi:MAG: ABC transporter permease, partial [Anaerolineales bacterium]